jgi:hypothetical protein
VKIIASEVQGADDLGTEYETYFHDLIYLSLPNMAASDGFHLHIARPWISPSRVNIKL